MSAHFCLSVIQKGDAWDDWTSHGNLGIVLFILILFWFSTLSSQPRGRWVRKVLKDLLRLL